MRAHLPTVTIPCSQRKPLKRLVAAAFSEKNRIAPYLSAEYRRAQFCEDDALPEDTVAVGREVSYRLDWGTPTPHRTLVYPGAFFDEETQISLFSPIGTALLGLKVGDRTDVFLAPTGFHGLQVASVKKGEDQKTLPQVKILASDFDRLVALAESASDTMADTASFLRRELERAVIISDTQKPSVQMGSRVSFRDHDGGRARDVRLVYPAQSDPQGGCVSILTPVGSALIGLEPGATMTWRDRSGRIKEMTVLSVH